MHQPSAFEAMLTGGHPNSLGNMVKVVDFVLADTDRLEERTAWLISRLTACSRGTRRSVAA